MALIGAGVIPVGQENRDEWRSTAMPLVFGGMFALAGGVAFVQSRAAVRRHERRKAVLARHPNEPWLADYAWDPRGIDDGRTRQIGRVFRWAAFIIVWMAPFHWLGFTTAPVVLVFVALFDLAVLLLVGRGLYLLAQQRKYGTSRLEFDRFPYHPGQSLDVTFTNANIGAYQRLTVTLRFIEDEVKVRGTRKNRRYEITSWQLYADRLEDANPGELTWADCPLALSFPLPEGDVTNRLLATRSPRYWELEVRAAKPGVDYRAVFLVPVYARPE